MAVPYQRVALFILFDSIERDLKDHIRDNIDGDNFLAPEEEKKAKRRLEQRENSDIVSYDESALINALDLGDKYDILLRNIERETEIGRYFRKQHPHFIKMISVRNDIMHGRPLTMEQQVKALAFAQDLLLAPKMWPNLAETYRLYSENPTVFLERSITFLDEAQATSTLHNLPVPDFDDTGWLPREKLEAELRKKIFGRNPVVSILGDGGNGKTALALQVLHGLVRSADHPFDAIIWTSAKAATLTVDGIRVVESATTDALSIIDAAAMLEPGGDSPIERLTKLLEQNKILLVIDNYESIVGSEIADFAQEVPGESKILFTSRHPIGGDLVVHVDELSPSDAKRYFWRLVNVYGLVGKIKSYTEREVDIWLERLSYKPLSIKWLVLGLKAGLNPDSITMHPDDVLRFCLDNVIDQLGDCAQAVIYVLATLPTSVPLSIVQSVSNLQAEDVADGVAELNRYNLIEADTSQDGSLAFRVRPFARTFIHRLIKPKVEISEKIIERYRAIEAEFQSDRGAAKASPYSFKVYVSRNRSEYLVSKRLRDAVALAFEGVFDTAEEILTECKTLEPGYFENFRAEAMIAAAQNDLSRAIESCQTALRLDANQAHVHYLLGSYFLRLQSTDKALECFIRAIDLNPDFHVYREAARAEMQRFEFDGAKRFLSAARERSQNYHFNLLQITDLELQVYVRQAEYLCRNHWYEEALECAQALCEELKHTEDALIDQRTQEHILKIIPTLIIVRQQLGGCEALKAILKYLEGRFGGAKSDDYDRLTIRQRDQIGFLSESGRQPSFGFIKSAGNEDAFVHKSQCGPILWTYLLAGGSVLFDHCINGEGKFAVSNLRPEDHQIDTA